MNDENNLWRKEKHEKNRRKNTHEQLTPGQFVEVFLKVLTFKYFVEIL